VNMELSANRDSEDVKAHVWDARAVELDLPLAALPGLPGDLRSSRCGAASSPMTAGSIKGERSSDHLDRDTSERRWACPWPLVVPRRPLIASKVGAICELMDRGPAPAAIIEPVRRQLA
jgi:hypothetical protein